MWIAEWVSFRSIARNSSTGSIGPVGMQRKRSAPKGLRGWAPGFPESRLPTSRLDRQWLKFFLASSDTSRIKNLCGLQGNAANGRIEQLDKVTNRQLSPGASQSRLQLQQASGVGGYNHIRV
jgi:hypothetical protein